MGEPRLFVMAGDYGIAVNWAKEEGIDRSCFNYLHKETQLMGHRNVVIKQLYGWDERPYRDVRPIMDQIAIVKQFWSLEFAGGPDEPALLERFKTKVVGLPARLEE